MILIILFLVFMFALLDAGHLYASLWVAGALLVFVGYTSQGKR